jgi:hypothetical protein
VTPERVIGIIAGVLLVIFLLIIVVLFGEKVL